MPKGNEDLKAKIAKIQQKGKALPAPVPAPEVEDDMNEEDLQALEAEYEARKKALEAKKAKASPASVPMDAEGDQSGLEEALAEYSDEAKFRVEVIFQLVNLNKSMKEIADALKSFANNGE